MQHKYAKYYKHLNKYDNSNGRVNKRMNEFINK